MTHYFWTGDCVHTFHCNECGAIAGSSHDEQQALKDARAKADLGGWKWFHPGWGLLCPNCQRLYDKPRMTER